MYLLYKDPEGKSINSAASPNTSVPEPNNYDASLEGALSDKNEQIIMKLRLENSMLKVTCPCYCTYNQDTSNVSCRKSSCLVVRRSMNLQMTECLK